MVAASRVSFLASSGMVGFLMGIFLHSLRPYVAVPFVPLGVLGMGCLGVVAYGGPKRKVQIVAVFLLLMILGIGRFEVDRIGRKLPGGLEAFNPDGFAYVVNRPPVNASKLDPRVWLADIRFELTRRTRLIVPSDHAALLSGILYGERNFSKTQKDIFRRAGLLHIVAVSGSNVTILVCLVIPLFLALGCSRQQAFIGLSIGLVLFVLFVSPSASVVRAALMGWLVQFAPMVGRLVRPSRILLVSGCVFVLWKPWALLFDVSFALSFLAMGGLMTWGAWIGKQLEAKIESSEIREIVSSTLGATIMTIPYSAWAFGNFTVWGLVTNLLVLPIIPWSMLFGSLALFFYRVPFVALPVRGCLEWIMRVAGLVRHLPFGAISLTPTVWQMLMVYFVLSILFFFVQRKKPPIHKREQEKRKN